MRRWIGALCIFILLQLAAAAPQGQSAKASIEGVVTRIDNGQPIAGAQLMISRIADAPQAPAPSAGPGINVTSFGPAGVTVGGAAISASELPPLSTAVLNRIQQQIAPVTTDANGKFQFKDLEPGTFSVSVAANGFVRQVYGQRSLVGFGTGTPIALTAGQAFKNVTIRLTPTGTVSGRIMDDTGRPAIGVPVVVLHYLYSQPGLKTLQQVGTGNTDDRGVYRIYGIRPGRYYVAAGNSPDPAGLRGASGQTSNTSYTFRYFPGVNDVAQASLVDIRPGEDAFADMTALKQKLSSVRGRVVDSTGQLLSVPGLQQGQSPVSVSLTYAGIGGGGSYSSGRGYDPVTGKFELLNVIPGTYVIQAQLANVTPLPPITGNGAIQERLSAQAARPFAELPIVVQNADLENLVLTFATLVSAPGKLSVEGQQLSNVPGYESLSLQIRRFSNGSPIVLGTPPQARPFNADGTFQVLGMRPGEYRVSFFGPSTYFVKSLRYDGKDILGKTLEFSGTIGAGFDILLSPKSGQVSGTVTDAKMQPVPGIQAVVIPSEPDDKRDRADLYKYYLTDQNGHFTIAGITPGNYKLFAWDGMEPFRYFDPDFMKTYEAKGKSIVVGESAVVTADIQFIPVTEP